VRQRDEVRVIKQPLALLAIAAVALLMGCGSGGTDAPTVNRPALTGPGGVPIMSQEELAKLSPERRAQIEQGQQAMEAAAKSNMSRKNGKPGG
jgi:hypothetical protein